MTEVCKTSLMIDNEAIARGRGRPVPESRLVILEAPSTEILEYLGSYTLEISIPMVDR